MQGKIIKGIAGFYYVYAEETDTIYECKAKGIFRNRRVKPLVGDLVAIEVLDEEQAKRKAFQRTRLKASRMTLKSLPTSLSQRLTLRLMQNVKRYLLYSIYITYTNKGHVIRVPYLLIPGFTVHT